MKAGKRRAVDAELKASTVPVVPPRSGMASSIAGVPQHPGMHRDINTGPTVEAQRPPVRRRAVAKSV